MAITPLPTPPSTSDPANFDARADAFLGAMPTMVSQINTELATIDDSYAAAVAASAAANSAILAALNSANLLATSTATLTLATGSQAANLVETGKAFGSTDAVVYINRDNPSIRVYGNFTAFNSGTGAATLNKTSWIGAGTPSAKWWVIPKAFEPFIPPDFSTPYNDMIIPVTSEKYAAATGTALRSWRASYDLRLWELWGELSVAQASGSAFAADVKVNGSTILTNGLNFDNTEATTLTSSVPPVLTGGLGYKDINKGDLFTVDVTQVGVSTTAKGFKLHMIYQRRV